MKIKYLSQAWLVLALSVSIAAALAVVQVALAARIRKNKLDETMGQIPSLVSGATGGKAFQIDGRTVYRAVDGNGKQLGWVVPASGPGFADVIEVLIGLDNSAKTITGLYVLDQKETPGLGNNITKSYFQDRFKGQPTASALAVVKSKTAAGRGKILALTGATISSVSVTRIVNNAVAELGAKLAAAAK